MSETTHPTVSRRSVLAAGAAGLGATAIGALPGAAWAPPVGDASVARAGTALGLGPEALPPIVPGTYAGAVSWVHAQVWAQGSTPTAQEASGSLGVYATNGSLDLALPLQAGDALVRLDVYFRRTTTGVSGATLYNVQVAGGGLVGLAVSSASASGIVAATFVPGTPPILGVGNEWFLTATGTAADNCLLGAIYQYRPAQPRLNLLASPVRVYDSRPGNPPTTGPKTPLVGGSVRANIDATNNGSGVPAGAAAILANVTVVNTVASGFLLVYENGVPTPLASTVNWFGSGQVLANGTTIALDTSARFSAFVGTGASTDFFVDVLGYYL